jgi:raffinose/stachyose/melibiose transport system substrate-binding protein
MATPRKSFRTARAQVATATIMFLIAPAMAQEKIDLEVWSWQVSRVDNYERIFEVFEAANPDIEVTFRGFQDSEYPAILRTGLSSSDGPDLVFLHPYGSVAPYSRSGQLVAITPETVPELANFTEAAVAAARIDDQIWGVPFAQQSLQVYYNKTIFADLGLVPPTKASEVQPLLDAVVAGGVTPFATQGVDGANLVFYFDVLTGNTYGGKDFIESVIEEQHTLDTPEMVAAFAQYADYQKYFPQFVSGVTGDDASSLFLAGQAAMYPNGSWMLGFFRDQDPDLDIGVFTMPADENGGPAPVFGYEDGSISLSAASEHPEEAMRLLRWMASPEFGQLFTDELKQASSVVGTKPSDPVLQEMVENYQANPVPVMWVTELYGTTAPAPFATLSNLLSRLLVGSVTPEDAAKQLQSDAEEFRAQR